jgi:Cof subfamily protein (haloacid dehalogenase superfamily)
MYKLVAVDIDGTLLNDNKELTKETKRAINESTKLGVKVVITTGRIIQSVKELIEELGLEGEEEYVIANNGCTIYNTRDYSLVYEKSLKDKNLKEVYKKYKRKETVIEVHTLNGILTEDISEHEHQINRYHDMEILQKDFQNDKIEDQKLVKILVKGDEKYIEELTKVVPRELHEKYAVVRSLDHLLEFMYKGSSKAKGLEVLGEILGIKREEIIAIGDGINDLEMIEYAGLGVAMGNAKEEVKKVANFITKSNEENGVAYTIEKFILKDRERNGRVG